jgi:para-nitrobenzyl esterase
MNRQGKPSYMYLFTREMPGDDSGAFHACDLWYTFGRTAQCWRPLTEEDEKLSESVMDNWAEFFRIGRPADEDWTPCEEGTEYIREFC